MKPPHGQCSDYSDQNNFDNQWQCYRQCLKNFAGKQFECKPVFIDYTIHELDFTSNDLKDCNSSIQRSFDELIVKKDLKEKCLRICPKDCLSVNFKIKVINNGFDGKKLKESTHLKKSIVFDSTQPIFLYKEEAVMSFTDYLSYCGGLVGLWFGTSAQNIIDIASNIPLIKYLSRRFKNDCVEIMVQPRK
jgi:hypothetical protein